MKRKDIEVRYPKSSLVSLPPASKYSKSKTVCVLLDILSSESID